MSYKLTIECATLEELSAAVAALGGTATSPPAKPARAAGGSKTTSETATGASQGGADPKASSPEPSPEAESSSSTPDPAKGDAGEAMPQADFVKYCIDNSLKFHKDDGAALKAIWARLDLKDAEGKAVERLGQIRSEDYAAVIAEVDAEKI